MEAPIQAGIHGYGGQGAANAKARVVVEIFWPYKAVYDGSVSFVSVKGHIVVHYTSEVYCSTKRQASLRF
jgi:hypothetical protein